MIRWTPRVKMSDNLNNSRKPQAEKVATATAAGNISQQQQQQQQQKSDFRLSAR